MHDLIWLYKGIICFKEIDQIQELRTAFIRVVVTYTEIKKNSDKYSENL